MKYYIKFLLILFSVSFFSCQKDVLDKGPLDVIDEGLVWEDPNLAQLYLNNIYLQLPGGLDRSLDCATEIGEGAASWFPSQVYNTGEVTPADSPYSDSWYQYSAIRSLNEFLEKYNMTKGDPGVNNQLRGQALFLRAYFYSELINFFGGVPIIVKAQELGDDLSVKRNTYDECVEFIVKDLTEAAGLLPDQWDAGEVGKVTKGAALAIKSRQLLYAASPLNNPQNNQAKWQKAADAAKAVIDSHQYSLFNDYNKLFLTDNNEEVIFDIQYGYPYRANDWTYLTNPQGFSGAYGLIRPTQDFVDRYEMKNGKNIKESGSTYDAANPYANRDPRFYASVLYNGAAWRNKTIETFVDGANGPGLYDEYSTSNVMTGYYIKKFLNESNPIIYGDNRGNENWILIRYGEVLLNYAEAELNLGNDAVARTYINLIRKRAGMPDVPGAEIGQTLRNRYINERTIELAFEDNHFFDVRRWKTAPQLLGVPVHKMTIEKVAGDKFTYKVETMEPRTWRDAFYHLPIPESEIDKNPNLKQNEGY